MPFSRKCLLACIAVFSRSVASKLVPLYRYVGGWDHFYTTNPLEIGTIIPGQSRKGYKSEGIACTISDTHTQGSVPLYRYWKNGEDHFYTTSSSEIGTTRGGQVGRDGYRSEGIAGYCWPRQVAGTIPFYRYYKSIHFYVISKSDHFYTTSASEIGTTIHGTFGNLGYKSEGVACYVYPAELACKVTQVTGRWKRQFTIVTPTEQSFHWGSSKTHETSTTKEWSKSMSVAVSAGFSMWGASTSVEVTASVGSSISKHLSEAWTSEKGGAVEFKWGNADVGKTVWQFVFEPTDSCQNKEKITTKEFAVTEGAWREPCCLPGWSSDAPSYTTCRPGTKVSSQSLCHIDGETNMFFP